MNTVVKYKDLMNETGLKFTDISSEATRRYQYRGEEFITVDNPIALNVSKAGGHRILDGQGVSHYIPKGWIGLSWKAKEGNPHFVK